MAHPHYIKGKTKSFISKTVAAESAWNYALKGTMAIENRYGLTWNFAIS